MTGQREQLLATWPGFEKCCFVGAAIEQSFQNLGPAVREVDGFGNDDQDRRRAVPLTVSVARNQRAKSLSFRHRELLLKAWKRIGKASRGVA